MKYFLILFSIPTLAFSQLLTTSYDGQTLYSKYLALQEMNLDSIITFETVFPDMNITLKEKVKNLAIETKNLKQGFSRANWKSDQFGKLYTSINSRLFEMKQILYPSSNPENLWINPKPLSQFKREFSKELGFPVEEIMSFEIKLGKVLLRLIDKNKELDQSLSIAKDYIKKEVTVYDFIELLNDLNNNMSDCSSNIISHSSDELIFELVENSNDEKTVIHLSNFIDSNFKIEKQNLQSNFYGYKIAPLDSEASEIKYLRFGYNDKDKLTSVHFELNNSSNPFIYCSQVKSNSDEEFLLP